MSWNRINISIHVQLEIFVSPGLLPLFLIAKQLLKTNFPVSQPSTLMLLKYPCLTSWRRSLGTSCWNSDSTHCNKLSPTTAKAFLHKVFLYRIHSWVLEPDYFSLLYWWPSLQISTEADMISGKGIREISLTSALQHNPSLFLEARLWSQIFV